jgi:hypothetical protein
MRGCDAVPKTYPQSRRGLARVGSPAPLMGVFKRLCVPRRPPSTPETPSLIERCSVVPVQATKIPACGDFRALFRTRTETPSLPWRFRGVTRVHARSLATQFFLQIHLIRLQTMRREASCVSFLMCPFCVRGRVPVETTKREPETARSLRRVRRRLSRGGQLGSARLRRDREGPSRALPHALRAPARPLPVGSGELLARGHVVV